MVLTSSLGSMAWAETSIRRWPPVTGGWAYPLNEGDERTRAGRAAAPAGRGPEVRRRFADRFGRGPGGIGAALGRAAGDGRRAAGPPQLKLLRIRSRQV